MSLSAQRSAPPVVLVFPGQGTQHARMAAGLYGHDETFSHWMDEAFRLLAGDGPRLRSEWLAAPPSPAFDDVTVAQPLLYAVNHALGRMLLAWGVRPVALLGHSVGEFAAATLAGVFDFADGVRLMRDRIACFAGTPPGGMLAVAASVDEVDDLLDGRVHLAAVNAARQLLLAGEHAPLAEAARTLRDRELICREVPARQAFHSPVVAGAVRATLPRFRAVPLRPPRLPVYSAYTQGVLTDLEALDPAFWAWQAARTVYFAPTLAAVLADRDCVLVETGPGDSLSRLARRHPAVIRGFSSVLPLLGDRRPSELTDPARGDQADRRAAEAARSRLVTAQDLPRPALIEAGGRGV